MDKTTMIILIVALSTLLIALILRVVSAAMAVKKKKKEIEVVEVPLEPEVKEEKLTEEEMEKITHEEPNNVILKMPEEKQEIKEIPDYPKMTRVSLLELAHFRNLKVSTKMRKDEIIQKLEESDKSE